jgi:ankyrin repeat protein
MARPPITIIAGEPEDEPERAPRDPATDASRELFKAAKEGKASGVRLALGNVALDINAQEPGTGATALHYAAANNAIDALRLLAAHPGCDFTITDIRGRTPATLAYEVAENPVTGRFLLRKEREQRRVRGTLPNQSS